MAGKLLVQLPCFFGLVKIALQTRAMATESSLAPPALETRSKKRTDPPGRPSPNPTGPKRRLPGEVFHSPSSGPPTPDFGDEACSGPAEWEIGEDSGGLPEIRI